MRLRLDIIWGPCLAWIIIGLYVKHSYSLPKVYPQAGDGLHVHFPSDVVDSGIAALHQYDEQSIASSESTLHSFCVTSKLIRHTACLYLRLNVFPTRQIEDLCCCCVSGCGTRMPASLWACAPKRDIIRLEDSSCSWRLSILEMALHKIPWSPELLADRRQQAG